MFTIATVSLLTVLIALLLAGIVAYACQFFGAPQPLVLLIALIVLILCLSQGVRLD